MSKGVRIVKPAPFIYPEDARERTNLILRLRPLQARGERDYRKPIECFIEDEIVAPWCFERALVIILRARECPWRCVMCDLWREASDKATEGNSVLSQIEYAYANGGVLSEQSINLCQKHGWQKEFALEVMSKEIRRIKLYNAGSFFDAGSIPRGEYLEIARRVVGFERVIVECHPKLVNHSILGFLEALEKAAEEVGFSNPPQLEVALGLESACDEVLALLNKKNTCREFASACEFLRKNNVRVRAFVLANPPFVSKEFFAELAVESVKFAFECGAERVVLIPVRTGNGVMDYLESHGYFSKIHIREIEEIFARVFGVKCGIVELDRWESGSYVICDCGICFDARISRLLEMGFAQEFIPSIECTVCGSGIMK